MSKILSIDKLTEFLKRNDFDIKRFYHCRERYYAIHVVSERNLIELLIHIDKDNHIKTKNKEEHVEIYPLKISDSTITLLFDDKCDEEENPSVDIVYPHVEDDRLSMDCIDLQQSSPPQSPRSDSSVWNEISNDTKITIKDESKEVKEEKESNEGKKGKEGKEKKIMDRDEIDRIVSIYDNPTPEIMDRIKNNEEIFVVKYKKQMERFLKGVKNIEYKLSIITDFCMIVIDKNNDIKTYYMKNKTHSGYINVIVTIDFDVLVGKMGRYALDDNLQEETKNVIRGFFYAVQTNHQKQASILNNNMKFNVDVFKLFNELVDKKNNYIILLGKFDKLYSDLMDKEQEYIDALESIKLMGDRKTIQDEVSVSITKQNLETSLRDVRNNKEDIKKNSSEIQTKLNYIIVYIDNILHESNTMYHNIINAMKDFDNLLKII